MYHVKYRISGQDFVLRKGRFSHFNETFIFRKQPREVGILVCGQRKLKLF